VITGIEKEPTENRLEYMPMVPIKMTMYAAIMPVPAMGNSSSI